MRDTWQTDSGMRMVQTMGYLARRLMETALMTSFGGPVQKTYSLFVIVLMLARH